MMLPPHLADDHLARELAGKGWSVDRIDRACERAAIMEYDDKWLRWKAEAIAVRTTWPEPSDAGGAA